MDPQVDPNRSALLSMDFQNSIVRSYGGSDELLRRAASVQTAARQNGIMVIHVHVGFRPGFPEVNPRNPLFGAVKSSPERQKMFSGDGSAFHPVVAPQGNEVVITKHRVNAFTNADLEMILRAAEIDTLFLMGIATSGVVLSTLTHAADRDYRIFIIGDCCADRDAELHRSLIERYFPNRGTVISSGDFAPL
jgi:nicotinamidase-related amidase